jgi:hypothetical protein
MKGMKSLTRVLVAGGLLAPLLAAAQAPVDLDHPAKQFSFEQTSFGSCVMQGGSLTFDAGGNGQVSVATMTTDNDSNIWKARVLLRNVAGNAIYTSPELNSPKMENSNNHPQTYRWSYSFRIDPQLMQSASTAQMIDIRC